MSIQPDFLFINLGVPELSIIVVLVLILFGPGKLPGVMKALGDGVKSFKDASNGEHHPVSPPVQQQAPTLQQTYQQPIQPMPQAQPQVASTVEPGQH